LVLLVTLACCYVACWGPTKSDGVDDVLKHISNADDKLQISVEGYFPGIALEETISAPVPLVLGIDYFQGNTVRRYYFWFFGFVTKLPFECELPAESLR
jgi:hypothetical protein